MSYFLMFVKLMVSQIVLANELFFGEQWVLWHCSRVQQFHTFAVTKKRIFQGLMINLCVILLGSKTHVVSNKSIVFQF